MCKMGVCVCVCRINIHDAAHEAEDSTTLATPTIALFAQLIMKLWRFSVNLELHKDVDLSDVVCMIIHINIHIHMQAYYMIKWELAKLWWHWKICTEIFGKGFQISINWESILTLLGFLRFLISLILDIENLRTFQLYYIHLKLIKTVL